MAGYDDWRDWGPSVPRPVDGGIRAKSQRGAIGTQWWSRRFIAVLESYGMSSRLARGRNYARKGQVIGFSLEPGKVTAKVQGSRVKPYSVRLGVRRLTAAQWRVVEARLRSQALYRAKLLAGEMPAEIEAVFGECGTPLFPETAADLEMSCSCPDWGVPCKHLAAVCYVLAEAFDADPFAMLAWRGRSRDELLATLRAPAPRAAAGAASGAAGAASGSTSGAAAGASASAASASDQTARRLGPPGPPLAECLDRFWNAGLSPARLRALSSTPAPATAPDLLLRMFEPPAVQIRGQDLADILAPAYHHLADTD
ncbi:MAG TPA: SWIM zinc finger family protein [Streptosporangiaceae bacterium]|nr:SWIM zinc finger family protein [Streptosporangiaceae bacterium]